MHQCLRVHDLLAYIAGYLERKDAFRFALASKKFFLEPGLDEVWREISSFEPLLACLPEGIWREQYIAVPEEQGDEDYTLLVSVFTLQGLLTSKCTSASKASTQT